ncbi:vacuolar protein sorting-associated protein 37A-like isoform X1 [Ornithodoros turicata]|uniref:vacuolar protein sorting-associated protein 37A-like isoform X1 n=1 Tax=Ornithodoros turicata TaxID=34597 RepID=UPI003139E3EC
MFHAIFGRRNSETVPQSPLQLQRQRQVATIRSWCPNVVEVQPDQEYHLNFVAGNVPLTLEICLPSSFPHESPELKVSPPVEHPLLDEEQHVTGVPALTAFSMHADLGRIINGIVTEFLNHPPTPCTNSGKNVPVALPSTFQKGFVEQNHRPVQQPFTVSGSKLGSQFLQLDQLSVTQLEELSRDEKKLSEFVEQLPEVLRASEIKNQMMCQNEALARKNLALKPAIEQRKSDLLAKARSKSEPSSPSTDRGPSYSLSSMQHAASCGRQTGLPFPSNVTPPPPPPPPPPPLHSCELLSFVVSFRFVSFIAGEQRTVPDLGAEGGTCQRPGVHQAIIVKAIICFVHAGFWSSTAVPEPADEFNGCDELCNDVMRLACCGESVVKLMLNSFL